MTHQADNTHGGGDGPMSKSRRHQAILKTVSLSGSARVGDLVEQLGVSGETVRRDLRQLVEAGSLARFHGGVQLPDLLEEPVFQQRLARNADAKRAIARAAATLVKDGDSLIIDTGTTAAYVARALRDHRNLLVVTSSVDVARCLAMRNGNRVFFAGSELRGEDGASVDSTALQAFERFWVAKAFLSVGAVDGQLGPMEYNLPEADLSRVLVQQARTRILVVDHSKFGHRAPIQDVGFTDVDILVTDRPPPPEFDAVLREHDVEVRVAAPD